MFKFPLVCNRNSLNDYWGPLSDISTSGIPCLESCFLKALIVVCDNGFSQLDHLNKVEIVVNNSNIVLAIKYKQVCANFGPGSSWGFSSSLCCSGLKLLQTEHWATWSLISAFIVGQ